MSKLKALNIGIVATGILGFLIFSQPALAGDVSIQNNVNVSASTGGNSGENVTEGEARVEIEVRGEVDGETLEPIIIKEESTGKEIKKEVRVESKSGQVKTEVKASLNEEAGMKSSPDDDLLKTKAKLDWRQSFLASIGNFFAQIKSGFWFSLKSFF